MSDTPIFLACTLCVCVCVCVRASVNLYATYKHAYLYELSRAEHMSCRLSYFVKILEENLSLL